MDGDYIVLNRKIQQWEWYRNSNTKDLFIHCLLNANWKDGKFEGVDVPRGTFVSSVARLSRDLGMSVRQVRVALDHLKLTGELTIKTTSKFSIITVNNYDEYQLYDKQVDNQVTNERQTNDKRMTNERQTNDKRMTTIEKGNKGIKEKGNNEKREEENPIEEKVIEKEVPKENMEQMYQRVSVDYNLSDPLYDKLKEWFKYKQERHQTYKERGMRSLLKQAVNSSHEYGDMNVCDLIDFSMQSNYQGIFWERLSRKSGKSLADRWRDA